MLRNTIFAICCFVLQNDSYMYKTYFGIEWIAFELNDKIFLKKNKQKIAPAEKLLFWLYKNRITINMKRAFAWISLNMNTVYFGSYLYFFLLLSFKNFILHTLFRYMVIVLFMRNLCIARVKRRSFLFSQSNACINNSTFTVDTVIF